MKFSKEDLVELLKTTVKDYMGSEEGFGGTVKELIQTQIKELQNDIVNPFTGVSAKALAEGLPFVKVDGDYLTTKNGSIINLKKKQAPPWVTASPEVCTWAKDFATYLKTGMVSKFLSEGVDSNGGYLVKNFVQ